MNHGVARHVDQDPAQHRLQRHVGVDALKQVVVDTAGELKRATTVLEAAISCDADNDEEIDKAVVAFGGALYRLGSLVMKYRGTRDIQGIA